MPRASRLFGTMRRIKVFVRRMMVMISTCAILADAIIISYVVEDHSIYMCVLETWRIIIKKRYVMPRFDFCADVRPLLKSVVCHTAKFI